jgi:hypothetical protein
MKVFAVGLLILLTASCSRPPDEPLDARELLEISGSWQYKYSCVLSDGGSIAYGFINEDGIPIYVFAASEFSSPSKRRIFLRRTINDPRSIEIVEGSELEAYLRKRIESSYIPSLVRAPVKIDGLFEMLDSRSAPFPRESVTNQRTVEQGGAHRPATAPDSRSEASEKPKPESEGRSQ